MGLNKNEECIAFLIDRMLISEPHSVWYKQIYLVGVEANMKSNITIKKILFYYFCLNCQFF